MKIFLSLYLLIFLFICSSSFAQLERANKYYDNREYAKAAKLYEEVLKQNENPEALEKIANSYRLIKNSDQAELYYARLMKQLNVAPINHMFYGMVLKQNNKIDEAQDQFKLYARAEPKDKVADLLIKSCQDIKKMMKKSKQFDVSPVPNINSTQSDFCPVVFKNQLIFVSNRTADLNPEDKKQFLHVYVTEREKGKETGSDFSKKIELFPWPINSDFHDGPICFNPEQNIIYLTHVELLSKRDKNFVNRSKIYTAKLKKNNKWSSLTPFQYNSDAYSVAHPSISADGQKLFFASDMPGGQGGMDIYVCEKDGENWGQPKNLGSAVNTAGEEVFPFINKDGTLFFSSNGQPGFGGLDVFSASLINKKYADVKNVGTELNSTSDDFGIVFTEDTKGYFSSDRPGGKGSDDIYNFITLNKSITIAGKITQAQNVENPYKSASIMLLSENGKLISESSTDEKGNFKFANLDPDSKYLIKLDETDSKFFNKTKYFLADEKNNFIRETGIDGIGGKFVFRHLPVDPNASSEVSEEGITFAGNLLIGKNSTKPLGNTKVNLVDENGKLVQTVYTNAFGAFVFTHLPADKNFLVKVDENDTKLAVNTNIILTNKSGKEMKSTVSESNGSFKFSFLASDKNTMKLMSVDDTELRVDFKGKFMDGKAPVANSVVNLINEKGEVLQSTTTDQNGAFQFSNLPADQNVLFTLDENDTQLKKVKKLYLTDSKGGIVKEMKSGEGVFKFSILPVDKQKIGTVYVDDPWLKVLQLKDHGSKENLTIVENIYYNYGEYKMLPEAAQKLDKVINIMQNDPQLTIEISSHTDSRSSKEYNLKLSQQRANEAVNYMVKNGIAKNRIVGKGYGESRLINKCADGVECTEEEHAKNRRTEFQIARKEK